MLRATAASLAIALLSAVPQGPAASAATEVVKPIVFPVIGTVTYTDTYGAPRAGHTHEGQDLMGTKMLPLIAAVAGTIQSVTFNNPVGNSVVVKGADGWTYHYIHVNNDTPGTDDGSATRDQAFPANIVLGASVTQGQVVGYMGDSGNAESTAPHVHFEIRMPPAAGTYTGVPINPYQSLQQASVWSTTSQWDLRRTATTGPSDEQFKYGLQVGDKGLLCDWDDDGKDEVVIYRSGTWHLRDGTSSGSTARQVSFGSSTDAPLCGDVDGDGRDEPVLFAAGGTWTMRAGFGATDPVAWTIRYGLQTGDKPVLGDWDGDGDEDLAIHRAGSWYIRSSGAPVGSTVTVFPYGQQVGDKPVAGDWDGDGDDDAGIYRGSQWHLRSTAAASGSTTSVVTFGEPGSQPVVGYGSDPVKPGIGLFRPKS